MVIGDLLTRGGAQISIRSSVSLEKFAAGRTYKNIYIEQEVNTMVNNAAVEIFQ